LWKDTLPSAWQSDPFSQNEHGCATFGVAYLFSGGGGDADFTVKALLESHWAGHELVAAHLSGQSSLRLELLPCLCLHLRLHRPAVLAVVPRSAFRLVQQVVMSLSVQTAPAQRIVEASFRIT
jgi:hypothetical protein